METDKLVAILTREIDKALAEAKFNPKIKWYLSLVVKELPKCSKCGTYEGEGFEITSFLNANTKCHICGKETIG